MTRTEFRFSGFGGQGVITMAHVLGHGATIHAGLDATMTEAYGPEKTGGFSRGDVVVDDGTIDYPNVVAPDVVVTLSQDAFERDAATVADGGLVVVEDALVKPDAFVDDRPDATLIGVPAVALAEEVGRKVVANVLLLGTVVELAGTPPLEAVRDAVTETVPAGTEALNERAFARGREVFSAGDVTGDVAELQEVSG
ncbi:MAG: 2-oxoacid:acceptor oxidoreductase family protein [Haloarculaceae archaeon]